MRFTLITIFLMADAFAFNSVSSIWAKRTNNVHSRITVEALREYDFAYPARNIAITGNASSDFYEKSIYNATMHCDRNRNILSKSAAMNCRNTMKRSLNKSIILFSQNKINDGLFVFGRALHVIQDFVSHSNFIDLNEKEQKEVIRYFLEYRGNLPRSLRLTGWDHRTKKGEEAGALKGDSYGHDKYAKDNFDSNKEAKLIFKGNRTKYDEAFAKAVYLSKLLIYKLKKSLPEKLWKQIKLQKAIL